jgi:uncharacterized membrane protein YhhN
VATGCSVRVLVASAACAILALALVYAEYIDSRAGRWIAKPLASLSFVVAGAKALPLDGTFGRLMLAGLVLAALGDVLLIPRRLFLAGVGAFLLGHVLYAVAFVARGVLPLGSAIALAPVMLATGAALRWLYPHVPRAMTGAIVAYCVVISSMVVLAAGTREGWIIAGAIAFYASDLAVARNRFVKESFVNRAWGLPLYYGAQLALATGASW